MKRAAPTLLALGLLVACVDSETPTSPEASLARTEVTASPERAYGPAEEAPIRTFQVTVENLVAEGQWFTPPLLATHRGAFRLFREGRAASQEIQQIAENGNLGPAVAILTTSRHVSAFQVAAEAGSSPAPLAPGSSITLEITADPGSEFLSFASMLICTNDGFTGTSGTKLPNQVGEAVVVDLPAFDAGTEMNTQDFSDLVPPCPALSGVMTEKMGTGSSNPALWENGVIHLHHGIQTGIGDLMEDPHGWMNPVARVIIRRTG